MKITAVVLIADGIPDSDNEAVLIDDVQLNEFIDCVPVARDCDPRSPRIGTAKLTKNGCSVIAELDIPDDKVAQKLVGYYPSISATVDYPKVKRDGVVQLISLRIRQIAINEGPNCDPRIGPFRC